VSLNTGLLNIKTSFKDDKSGLNCSLNVTLQNTIPAYFNEPYGCAPCIGGAGTNYWSYPGMKFVYKPNITIGGVPYTGDSWADDGIGWLDHQWAGGYPYAKWTQILQTIANRTKFSNSLGKYVWLTLHISDKHYMLFNFAIPIDSFSKVGDTSKVLYNVYTKTNVTYNNKGTIKILQLTSPLAQYSYSTGNKLGTVIFPLKYLIILDNEEYVLDGTPYGECYCPDGSNNIHYTSSAVIYKDKVVVGTGFIEGREFQDPKLLAQTSLSILGLEDSYDNIQKMVLGGKSSPAILILTLWLVLLVTFLILIIVSCVKIYKHYRKKSKK